MEFIRNTMFSKLKRAVLKATALFVFSGFENRQKGKEKNCKNFFC